MSNYFRRLPDLEYINRLKDSGLSDYINNKELTNNKFDSFGIWCRSLNLFHESTQGN